MTTPTPTPTIDQESVELTMAEAKRFMEDYYKAFDANRAGLVELYREDSVLKCDRREIKGKEAIVAELASSLQQRRRRVDRIGLIPSGVPGGALAMVSGYVWPDGGFG